MATVTLTAENFDEVTGKGGIVLVDFWATWCGPCRQFAPTYERSSEQHPDITFGKVDTEAQQELAAKFKIQAIPTIMAVRDGFVVYSSAGAMPPAKLESLIEQVEKLDMDDLKKQLADAQAEAKAKTEAQAKAKAEAQAKAKAEAEAKVETEAEAQVKAEAEAPAEDQAEAPAEAQKA